MIIHKDIWRKILFYSLHLFVFTSNFPPLGPKFDSHGRQKLATFKWRDRGSEKIVIITVRRLLQDEPTTDAVSNGPVPPPVDAT